MVTYLNIFDMGMRDMELDCLSIEVIVVRFIGTLVIVVRFIAFTSPVISE